ncbi:MAG: hypothetical protein KatS3mg085_316 [Candidatus Dojkabacteria bacterium]|nr:MAG: hypothetical protein KatS3mg085_316 [Candidatus Dojkabacteria bacterium]
MIEQSLIIIDAIKIAAIVFAVGHFLAGLLLFRDMIRINKSLKTKNSSFFNLLSFIYLLFLLFVLIIFILA